MHVRVHVHRALFRVAVEWKKQKSGAQDFTVAADVWFVPMGWGRCRGVMDCLARLERRTVVSGRTSFDVPP